MAEYCEGISLETRLAQAGGRLRWDEVRPLFMTLMTSLTSLHAAGILHLGISRRTSSSAPTESSGCGASPSPRPGRSAPISSPSCWPGYSAPEQYGFDQTCTASADVYAMAATIFRTVTGNPPPEGPARAKNSADLFVPADVADSLPDNVAVALFNGLQVDPEVRTASMAALRDQLSAAPAVSALRQDADKEPVHTAPEPAPQPGGAGGKAEESPHQVRGVDCGGW